MPASPGSSRSELPMALRSSSTFCALAAGVVAAAAAADERAGLGLALALLLVLATGAFRAGAAPLLLGLAAALAAQPFLRDAGWVVAIDVAAALVAAAAAVMRPAQWSRVRGCLLAPLRLVAGSAAVARTLARRWPDRTGGSTAPLLRGLALGAAGVYVFGILFASADQAFAELLGDVLSIDVDAASVAWRVILGIAFAGVAGAIACAAEPAALTAARAPRHLPGRTELRIALGCVVALFAVFVAVQLRVMFGGADYVRETTGLGYGDYARQGFVRLLLAAALTLAVVAVAARRPDRVVRLLLGALCVLMLVVLASAHHRLGLAVDSYGLTRVRVGGQAVLLWLAALLTLVLAAGAHRRAAERLPRVATVLTLAGVLGFSLSNPDGRIARHAVDRAQAGETIDVGYLRDLSADALPALRDLPGLRRAAVTAPLERRLARGDGLGGLNLARASAR